MTRDSHVRVYAWLARVLLPSWLQGDGRRKRGTGNREPGVSFIPSAARNRRRPDREASVPGSQFPLFPIQGWGVRSCPLPTGLTPKVRDTLPVFPALSVTRAVTVTDVFPAGMMNLPPATHAAVVVTWPFPR